MVEQANPVAVDYDLAVIGGGINGCSIARDAVGRGLSVLLLEQGDLAQGTSSKSTKLIHGGLRYLEYYEFRLVREALTEREVLLSNAPHIIWPLRFVLPYQPGLRPAWLLRLGLFIYDYLGGRKILPATQTVHLKQTALGQPLKANFDTAFEYSDCWVDDARFVALNALDAAQRGADIRVRTTLSAAQRQADHWRLQFKDNDSAELTTATATVLVNAAGPWVDQVLQNLGEITRNEHHVRLVRGSHIVVPKLYEHDRAYFFQNQDGRIIFAIPYEQAFTLIGTTDQDHHSGLTHIEITLEETQYLCAAASGYFQQAITPDLVVWSYAGVRPLFDDGASQAQAATRDYVLEINHDKGQTHLHELDRNQAALLNVYGGKITTSRRLAEDTLSKLQAYLPQMQSAWTSHAALPGGEFAVSEVNAIIQQLQSDYAFLDAAWAHSLIRRYGKRAWNMLGNAQSKADLGQDFGATLTEREIGFLQVEEWARTAEDILWRRSKIGLHMTATQRQAVSDWFTAQGASV